MFRFNVGRSTGAFAVPIVVLLALVALLGRAYAAQGGIAYNALYDCGPGRNQFKVLSCSGGLCTLFYPKGNGGVGFKTQIDRESLAESINGAYGGTRKPCTVAGSVIHATTNADIHPKRVAPRAAPAARLGPIVAGRYECYTYSGGELEAALMENFSITGNGRYRDASGHAGTYTTSAGIMTFHGGGLNGRHAHYVAGQPGSANPPHVQFQLPGGGSADECDGKG